MGLLSKKTIRTLAIICISVFLACSIVSIILAGLEWDLAGPSWKSGYPWYALPGLQIACIIYAFVIAILGYFTFCKPNIGCTIAYSIFLMLSLLFCIAIAIFSFIAGSHGWVNTYFGCNGKFDGVLGMWQGIDSYLQQVDQNFCGPNCPCYISNTNGFTTNSTVAPFYNQWTKTNDRLGNTAYQNCSSQVQSQTYSQAAAKDALFDPNANFDQNSFANYMQRVESRFSCAGWCNVTYFNTNTNTNAAMFKYNFNNINNGPAQNLGCLNSVINWLPPYLNAFGAVTMVLAGFQMIVFALAICQCWARDKDHEHQIPHHHDDNRQ